MIRMTPLMSTICVSLLCFVCVGCDDHSQSADEAETKTPSSNLSSSIIQPNHDLISRLTVAPVMSMEWRSQLKVSGRVDLDEKRVARVGSTVSGRVTDIRVLHGDRVHKGDVLALVHSSALAEAQMAYLKAFAVYDLAKKSSARAKILFQEGVISSSEHQKRDSERLSSEAEWLASKDRMQILGMSQQDIQSLQTTRQISSMIAIRSPIDGVVIDRKVSKGQVLEPADMAYSIADLSRVWVIGEVPERYTAQMRVDKQVQIIIPALSNQTLSAKLSYVADIVTPQTRTLKVHAELDNPHGLLKPEMLATLQIDGAISKKLAIPVRAVFREDNQDKVFVQVKEGQYRIQTVHLGEEENNFRPVESGLVEGDQIVVDGVFQLNADRLIKQDGV